jgi:hypothetical protein
MKIKKILFAAIMTLASVSSIQSASADGSYISGDWGKNCGIASRENPIRCNNGKELYCDANVPNSNYRSQCIETEKGCNSQVRCETFDSNGNKTSSYVARCY